MRSALLGLALSLGLASLAHADSEYSGPAERRFSPYVGNVYKCDEPAILGRMQGTFRTTQNAYYKQDLQLTSFDRIKELSLRGNGTAYIPRRYCIARAYLNDQTKHTVIYQIQEDLGMIGWGQGVEWCVVGVDRDNAYNPACSVLRPFAQRFLGEKVLVERY